MSKIRRNAETGQFTRLKEGRSKLSVVETIRPPKAADRTDAGKIRSAVDKYYSKHPIEPRKK